MNCVNSMNAMETEADTRGFRGMQMSMMESHVSLEKFGANIDILESMCEGHGLLDDDYGDVLGPQDSWGGCCRKFSKLTKLLKRKVFMERAADLGTL